MLKECIGLWTGTRSVSDRNGVFSDYNDMKSPVKFSANGFDAEDGDSKFGTRCAVCRESVG